MLLHPHTHCSPSALKQQQHASSVSSLLPAASKRCSQLGPQLRRCRAHRAPSPLGVLSREGSAEGSTATTPAQLGANTSAQPRQPTQPQPAAGKEPSVSSQRLHSDESRSAGWSNPTPADVQGEFPAIFDYQHVPHFSLPLALYFPFGVVIGSARVALWIICIALDLPVFRNRSVIDAYLALLGVKVTWHGLNRLPKGFHVMVSNHSNCGDLMALFTLPQRRYIHLISPAIPPQTMSAKHLPVLLRPAVLDTYEELAESAHNPNSPPVHVFPEGGMTNGKGIMQFSRGFAKLAPPGTPVVPVALRTHIPWGLRTHTLTSSFPVNLFLYNLCPQVHIEATVLPPMIQGEGEGVPPNEGRGAFVKRVQAAVAQHLGVPVSEINMQQKRQLMKEYQKRQQRT